MIYPRKLKRRILETIDNDLTVVITGMRRVGKTFLLHDLIQSRQSDNALILDFEKPEDAQVFQEQSYDAIVRSLTQRNLRLTPKTPGVRGRPEDRAWLGIDEIQRNKQTPSIVKYLTDHYFIKCIVTGSASYYLKNLFSESLSGRKSAYHLTPLDFGEYLVFQNLYDGPFASSLDELLSFDTLALRATFMPLYQTYLTSGGFPQTVPMSDPQEQKRLLLDILDSYLHIDVRSLSDIRGIKELDMLIRLLPPRIGQKMDISKLSREVGISRSTTKQYLDFLTMTYVAHLVQPFSRSPDRELTTIAKCYFCDVGLGGSLTTLSAGQRLENAVFTALEPRYALNYYQKKSGVEIDFILDKRIGIEVKEFATPRDYHRLERVARELSLDHYVVLSNRLEKERRQGILPAFLLGFLA